MTQQQMTDKQLQVVCNFYGITLEEGRANHLKTLSQGDRPDKPICVGCARWPEEIEAYVEMASDEGITPTEYVLASEGTLNMTNGHFLCDACYIANGQPSSDRGWKCP